jgi:hypothetical protein
MKEEFAAMGKQELNACKILLASPHLKLITDKKGEILALRRH